MKLLVLLFSLFLSVISCQAQFTIEGRVFDQKGNPLPGANIIWQVDGQTVADLEGKFKIICPDKACHIYVGAYGYQPYKRKVATQQYIEVYLKPLRYIFAGASSGFRYAPYGIHLTNYTHYLLGSPLMMTSSLEGRSNFRSTHIVDTYTRIENITYPLGVIGGYRYFQYQRRQAHTWSVAPELGFWWASVSLGYSYLNQRNPEEMEDLHGLFLGIKRKLFWEIQAELRANYFTENAQLDVSFYKMFYKFPIKIGLGYEGIFGLDEITASLQYRFYY